MVVVADATVAFDDVFAAYKQKQCATLDTCIADRQMLSGTEKSLANTR